MVHMQRFVLLLSKSDGFFSGIPPCCRYLTKRLDTAFLHAGWDSVYEYYLDCSQRQDCPLEPLAAGLQFYGENHLHHRR